VKTKDKLVMVGFGAGLTWGATVVEWGVPMPYKRRQWWYRGIRWLVYRWARLRSLAIRTSRRVESVFPLKNGHDVPPAVLPDIPKEEIREKPHPNGTKPKVEESEGQFVQAGELAEMEAGPEQVNGKERANGKKAAARKEKKEKVKEK
jgi:hypothetical protein